VILQQSSLRSLRSVLLILKNIPLIDLAGAIYDYDYWDVIIANGEIYGGTVCNNDEIWKLFEELNIPKEKVDLHDDGGFEWQEEDE